MIDLAKCSELERQPGKVSGNWVFKGTRLPLHAVLINLISGASLDEVAEWFEIERSRVEAVLAFLAGEANEPMAAEPRQAAALEILFDCRKRLRARRGRMPHRTGSLRSPRPAER